MSSRNLRDAVDNAMRTRALGEAEKLIGAHLATRPDDPEALRLLASVAVETDALADAEQLLRRAVASRPVHVLAYVDLTSLLCRLERSAEAVAVLDDVIRSTPGVVWALSLKGAALALERRSEEALEVHEQLVALAPHQAVPWMNYGHALQAQGRAETAAGAYRRSLTIDPTSGSAWGGLVNLRTAPVDERDIADMECALERITDDLNRAQLHFALGRALGDRSEFERSFSHYEKANNTRQRLAPYDADLVSEMVRRAQAAFTPDLFHARAGHGHEASGPIFIVGMPRSGSTLIEQILASHPMIEGLGELFELQNLVTSIAGPENASWPEVIAKLDSRQLRDLGERYLASIRKYRRTDRPFFTDKMPSNWRFVGLIQLILPNATIIDVRRNVLACGFSNYTTYFNRQTKTPTTLAEFGWYYCEYVDLVAHVDRATAGRIHQVRYEDVVADLEGQVARLLGRLNLEFDEACLRFHETQRAIHTPSAQQVRQQLNSDGLEHWRNYEAWLGPLKEAAEHVASP